MIEVVATMPLNTVQDMGREGYRAYGIGRAGAMDRLALSIGNIMVGNDVALAAIEIQMYPVRLRFRARADIALTGADCAATVNGRVLPPWWALTVNAGDELVLRYPRTGARAYLCVKGGVDVPPVLGSRTTHLRTALGGFGGRALQKGDVLPIGASESCPRIGERGFGAAPPERIFDTSQTREAAAVHLLRAVPAAEYDDFQAQSQTDFWESDWTVTAQSNRMGCRLQGVPLARRDPMEMRSHPIMPGVVQVPPSGQPIIQLEDGNTAGGYPKMAVVIDADLWRVGQMTPGTQFRFVRSTRSEAVEAHRTLQAYLSRFKSMCHLAQNRARTTSKIEYV